MAITVNAKGTSVPYFTIGKNGTTLYQGAVDPSYFYTIKVGDIWFDTNNLRLNTWGPLDASPASNDWRAPLLAEIEIFDSIISSTAGNDLTLMPSVGNDLYLRSNKWPYNDGSAGQVLTTDGSGNLSWQNQTITKDLTTTTTTANQVVDSISASAYRTVKYLVQVSSGADFQTSEILAIHDGTTVSVTEYGTLMTAGSIASFDINISSGNLQLTVTPVNASTAIRVLRTAIGTYDSPQ